MKKNEKGGDKMEEKNVQRKTYFAYGSNMEKDRMAGRCPDAEYAGLAELPNYKLALDSVGYAAIIQAPGETVQGCLWQITVGDEKRLNYYEGVSAGCYEKTTVRIRPEGYFSKFDALAYISLREENTGDRVQGYLEDIVDWARKIGLTEEYIKMLRSLVRGRHSGETAGCSLLNNKEEHIMDDNKLLGYYLEIVGLSYELGEFDKMLELISDDCRWDSQWVIEPRIGKDVLTEYYTKKAKPCAAAIQASEQE